MPPKERITPSLGIDPSAGRVAARPTDSFLQFTGNAAGSQLRDLARSLSRFGEQGGRIASQLQRQEQEKQTAAGRTAFLEAMEDQKDTAKAISQLKMRPQQSKWFRYGVQAEAGKADAMQARDYFIANYGEQLAEVDTLEEFDALASEALDAYKGDSPSSEAFDNGFFPSYMGMLSNLRYNFATGLDGKLKEKYIKSFYESNLAVALDSAQQGGVEGLGLMLTDSLDAAWLANPQMYEEAQEAALAIIDYVAYQTEDSSVYDVLSNVAIGPEREGGTGRTTLGNRFEAGPDGIKARKSKMIQARNSQWGEVNTANEIVKKEQLDELEKNATATVAAEGITDYRKLGEIADAMDALQPGAGTSIRNMVQNRVRFADFTETEFFESTLVDIWSGRGTLRQITSNMSRLSAGDARILQSELQSYENSKKSGTKESNILGLKEVNDTISGITVRFAALPGNPITADKGARVEAAQAEMRRLVASNADVLMAMPQGERIVALKGYQDVVTAQYGADIQGVVGTEEGPLATPTVTAPRTASDPEVRSIFFGTGLWHSQLARWRTEFGANLEGAGADPSFARFARMWATVRPGVPIGTSEFYAEWARLKDLGKPAEPVLSTPKIDTLSEAR